jgi:hypothetical protein
MPASTRQYPKATIRIAKARPRMSALQHQQLLPQTINRVFGLNIAAMAHSRSRNTRPSGRPSASRSDSPATCQRQRERGLFLRPSVLQRQTERRKIRRKAVQEMRVGPSGSAFRS